MDSTTILLLVIGGLIFLVLLFILAVLKAFYHTVEQGHALIVTGMSMLLALCVMAYLSWGSYTRKVQVQGVLMPIQGLTKLASPQGGLITAMKITEGQLVRRGDVLFEVSSQRKRTLPHCSRQLPKKQ